MQKSFGTQENGVSYREREGAYAVSFDALGRVALVEAPAARGAERGLFLPGGGIELGEDHRCCILRECLEETGRRVEIGEYLCTGDEYLFAPTDQAWLHVTGHCYRTVLGEQVQVPVETDHRLLFLAPEDCLDKLFLRYQAWAVEVAWRGGAQ